MMNLDIKATQNTQYFGSDKRREVVRFNYENSFNALLIAINLATGILGYVLYMRILE